MRTYIPASTLAIALSLAAISASAAPNACGNYAQGEFKPYVSGNVARKWEQVTGKNSRYMQYVDSIVIEAHWRTLEPTEGRYTFTKTDADPSHFTFAEKLSEAAANGKKVRIRVFAGTYAPNFAKTVNGFKPIDWINNDGQNVIQTLGPFWRRDYQQKWQNFQRALAREFNCDPRVNEIQISGTGVITPEVMLLQTRHPIRPGFTNGDSLRAGGFDDAQRNARLKEDVAFMQDTWTHTHLTLWLHPYVTLRPGFAKGWNESLRLAKEFHDRSPGHIAFGHTGAGESVLDGTDDAQVLAAYNQLREWRLPMTIQTQAIKPSGHTDNPGVGDIEYVIHRLTDWYNRNGYRTLGIELPTRWQDQLSNAKELMQEYNALMKLHARYQENLHDEKN